MSRVAIAGVLLAIAACGGSVKVPRHPASDYAAADSAFRSGDFDRAISGFTRLGNYRDAGKRLVQVRRVAGQALLANARTKLIAGHPRAAVALAETATARYGYATPAATAFLHRAQAAQAVHHRQQQIARRQGRPTG